jgi:hypothetical protein
MDSDNHLRVVDCQYTSMCPADQGSVLCYTMPTRPTGGRLKSVSDLICRSDV